MKQTHLRHNARPTVERGFTLIELLVVIAIIAILAAIVFPVFAAVRENARQSNTMSSLYSTYVATKLYYEDEGKYPTTLFGYAEMADAGLNPPVRPYDGTNPITPMSEITGTYQINYDDPTKKTLHRGYLYRDQLKDYQTFINSNNPIKDQTAITNVYYPVTSPPGMEAGSKVDNGMLKNGAPVVWEDTTTTTGTSGQVCKHYGDTELPAQTYLGKDKMFYKMDSMDIGPMIGPDGKGVMEVVNGNNVPVYELHYTPDWTNNWGSTCDVDTGGNPYTRQLKYKNPPTDKTILTYVTQHATTGNGKVILMLLSGTARKMEATDAYKLLPLQYK